MPHAEIAAGSVYYEQRGSGEPLLLIQGMAGHHALWGPGFLGGLDTHFEVVSYDHRGIGESSAATADFSIADLAADAVALIDALGWADAHVLGISMGGMVAQRLAIEHAERVRSLVLGCTYCGGPGSSLAAPGPLQMLQAMNTRNVENAIRAAYTANLSPAFTADPANYEPFRQMSLSVRVPVEVVMQQAKASFAHNTSAGLPGVDVPTLVLHGSADLMLDHANGALIAGLIPGARMHTLDGVGHLFWWEQPDLSATLVREHCLAATR